ncbi:MAG: type IV secretory system conjugative DNA transfer family protein, partial [Thiolinea sp.]
MKRVSPIGASQARSKRHTSKHIALRIVLNLLLLAVLLSLIASATTQYLAYQFSYAPQLSGHIQGIWYQPWSWAVWTWQYWTHYTPLMERAVILFCGGTILALILYAFARMMIRRQSIGIDSLHGTAHWANLKEIQETGLLSRDRKKPATGVYCGGWKDKQGRTHYLRHNGPEHVLAFAPTRSGKGVGLVLPTLLSWPHSCIVLDIKGENYALSAAWRRDHAHNLILKFDPT